jgi:hypothetical protein
MSDTYRVFHLGLRKIEMGMMKGIYIQRGSIIEKFDKTLNSWVYFDAIHPDDAEKFVEKKNKTYE